MRGEYDFAGAERGRFFKPDACLLLRRVAREGEEDVRSCGPGGDPTTQNLLAVIGALRAEIGVHLEVRATADAA